MPMMYVLSLQWRIRRWEDCSCKVHHAIHSKSLRWWTHRTGTVNLSRFNILVQMLHAKAIILTIVVTLLYWSCTHMHIVDAMQRSRNILVLFHAIFLFASQHCIE